jgi:hypothetical protein
LKPQRRCSSPRDRRHRKYVTVILNHRTKYPTLFPLVRTQTSLLEPVVRSHGHCSGTVATSGGAPPREPHLDAVVTTKVVLIATTNCEIHTLDAFRRCRLRASLLGRGRTVTIETCERCHKLPPVEWCRRCRLMLCDGCWGDPHTPTCKACTSNTEREPTSGSLDHGIVSGVIERHPPRRSRQVSRQRPQTTARRPRSK